MEQKEPFPADNPWLQQGPFGAGVGRFGSFSAIPAVFSCSPTGRVGDLVPVLPWSRGLTSGP